MTRYQLGRRLAELGVGDRGRKPPQSQQRARKNTTERIIAKAGVHYRERTKVTFYMTLDKLLNIQCWQNL